MLSDAGPHRIKITNLCRLCGKTACSKKTSARPKEKFKLEFERHSVNVEDDNDLIHPLILPDLSGVFLSPETVTIQSCPRQNPNYLAGQ